MTENEFNPLIPGNAVEDSKALITDNPLIPEQLKTSGEKRLASAISGKSKATTGAGAKSLLAAPDSIQLAAINKFANRELVAEEVFVGQMRLANNCIDRDNERFSEFTLQGFADTIVRKTLLLDHDRNVNRSAIGKFFAVEVEKLPLLQAVTETGENLRLPDGIMEAHFLSPWFYIPKKGISEQDLTRLEAGIFDFVSIGFAAERLVPITDGQGTTLFHEYQGKGQATEGSIVYLGAQFGAAIKSTKSAGMVMDQQPAATTTDNPLIPN